MNNFLTITNGVHKNNPTGSSLATVSSSVTCSPLDPISQVPTQDYPIEKLFLLRETFTKYTAFAPGDFLVVGGVTYAVIAVMPYGTMGSLDAYYRLIVEWQL